jgi:hypothetical protein
MSKNNFIIENNSLDIFDIHTLEKQFVPTEDDTKNNYNAFHLKNIQKYNPVYSLFFPINNENIDKISLKNNYEFMDMNTVKNGDTPINKSIFIKFSPLLDPIRYMIGKYDINDEKIRTLPYINRETIPKIENIHNASYVDCFFCYLTSKLLQYNNVIHGIDFYGSFLALQDKYKMNIVDDIEYLYNSPFFNSNIGKLFTITQSHKTDISNYGSRGNKNKLRIQSAKINITINNLDDNNNTEIINSNNGEHELVYEKNITEKSSFSDSSNDSKSNYSSDEEEDDDSEEESEDEEEESEEDNEDNEDEEESEESEEEEQNIFVYVNNYPIQMICLEKCDGTLDELFVKGLIDEKTGGSALFQIVMTLIIYQKVFHFTHNDLHTNNVMYINTDIKYIYYEYNRKKYRVPTYGRIYKIIDYGRSIYKFQDKLFCSDSFSPGGDGYTQYNFEPFFNENKPRLDPNYSFDLCRLGCSIYYFLIDDDCDADNMTELQKTIYRWCLDDNDKNVLYKKNGEERYPNFKLYKMISRTVHNHTPQNQLEYSLFSQYYMNEKAWKKALTSDKKDKNIVINIDSIPCYVNT